eukprot:gene18244-21829_t
MTTRQRTTTTSAATAREALSSSAQEAFKNNDAVKSREAHVPRPIDDEPHKSNSFKKGMIKYVKAGTPIGSYGLEAFFYRFAFEEETLRLSTGHDWNVIVVFLTTVIIAGSGLALAFIDAANKRMAITFYESEKRRETWEYDNYIEGEQNEMIELYCKKGMGEADAEVV